MPNRKEAAPMVTLGETTKFEGTLRFTQGLTIKGQFSGDIEAGEGNLIVDKGASVEAGHVNVGNLTVKGRLVAEVHSEDKVDFHTGAEVTGDVTAARLRIADGVLFEGRCNMVQSASDIEIFERPIDDIKNALQGIQS